MEHVRVFLARLPRDLDWQGVERAMEESCGLEGKEQVYKALNGQLYNMELDLQREAKHLITLLTEKVSGRMVTASLPVKRLDLLIQRFFIFLLSIL